jgi:hypothetical protein
MNAILSQIGSKNDERETSLFRIKYAYIRKKEITAVRPAMSINGAI